MAAKCSGRVGRSQRFCHKMVRLNPIHVGIVFVCTTPGQKGRQHCRLSICEYWSSWTNTVSVSVSEAKIQITLLILNGDPVYSWFQVVSEWEIHFFTFTASACTGLSELLYFGLNHDFDGTIFCLGCLIGWFTTWGFFLPFRLPYLPIFLVHICLFETRSDNQPTWKNSWLSNTLSDVHSPACQCFWTITSMMV